MTILQVREYAISEVRFNYLRYVNCTVNISGHPKYTGGILELASILKAAPVLEKLDLHVSTKCKSFCLGFSLYSHYVFF